MFSWKNRHFAVALLIGAIICLPAGRVGTSAGQET